MIGLTRRIGTYRGASSELMLRLLPDVRVISIAFLRAEQPADPCNNDELSVAQVGELVSSKHRDRYTQLIGGWHKIDPEAFVRDHGRIDLVFIDGDHSREGVRQDTELAHAILAPGGAIAWHDPSPKREHRGSRQFLEEDMPQLALATTDDFVDGVALWTQ
jgi:Methyltransferase domain